MTVSTITNMSKAYIDIGRYWLKDENGQPMSVNAIYQTIYGTENQLTRHTLTRARDGLLEKADISSLMSLVRLCSIWTGKKLTINDLVVEESEKSKINFKQPIAA